MPRGAGAAVSALAHLCLDAAEGALAQALLTVHLVRVMARAGDLPEP
ncbi:hypothetical protein ABT390_38600 [Streptomyces aurantiacus]|uniref:Uncharacterized protein n=1 Tax=Streptomyces aurantiacus JA 4570 TaxID=1286094 RepID=S3ZTA4_9ACTN|nr:hypothetical protein [Streptomyces aurantiacus]EPH46641.1 hypothetical protein STRAU_0305 [Streptomyces aurantiacus JA 4570]